MDKKLLIKTLSSMDIPAGSYSIEYISNESLCLIYEGLLWKIFYSERSHPTVRQHKGDPLGYHEALQVELNPAYPMRSKVRAYYVTEDIFVARGRAEANPKHGEGGGLQFYIPEEARLKLKPGKVIDI